MIAEKPTKEEANVKVLEKIGVIKSAASKHLKRAERLGLTFDDLVNAGVVIGIQAYPRYKKESGVKFSTFLYKSIRMNLISYLNNQNKSVCYPRDVKELAYRIYKLDKEYSVEELMRFFKKSERMIEAAIKFNDEKDALSFEGENEGFPVSHMFYKIDDFTNVFVEDFLNTLDEKEKAILQLKMNDMSNVQIGHEVGLSKSRVGNIIRLKIKPKLEQYYAEV
ncbi:sigma-70 family RNA polymerase sigma factor [Bacillus sp. JCM 19041]|uniref:sigma-70 family RNA polymerase sigma factor n=1 Tax=Bacillus sp. JCM 19041 TaxID=1460637 RepID=UPI0006D1A59D